MEWLPRSACHGCIDSPLIPLHIGTPSFGVPSTTGLPILRVVFLLQLVLQKKTETEAHSKCSLYQLVQIFTKRLVRGCKNYLPALAYLLCLALPGSCLGPAYILADLCT